MDKNTMLILGGLTVGGVLLYTMTKSSSGQGIASPTLLPVNTGNVTISNPDESARYSYLTTRAALAQESSQGALGTMSGIYSRLQDKLQAFGLATIGVEQTKAEYAGQTDVARTLGRAQIELEREKGLTAAELASISAQTTKTLGKYQFDLGTQQIAATERVSSQGIMADVQRWLADFANRLSMQQVVTGGQVQMTGIESGAQVSMAEINAQAQRWIVSKQEGTKRQKGLFGFIGGLIGLGGKSGGGSSSQSYQPSRYEKVYNA